MYTTLLTICFLTVERVSAFSLVTLPVLLLESTELLLSPAPRRLKGAEDKECKTERSSSRAAIVMLGQGGLWVLGESSSSDKPVTSSSTAVTEGMSSLKMLGSESLSVPVYEMEEL